MDWLKHSLPVQASRSLIFSLEPLLAVSSGLKRRLIGCGNGHGSSGPYRKLTAGRMRSDVPHPAADPSLVEATPPRAVGKLGLLKFRVSVRVENKGNFSTGTQLRTWPKHDACKASNAVLRPPNCAFLLH